SLLLFWAVQIIMQANYPKENPMNLIVIPVVRTLGAVGVLGALVMALLGARDMFAARNKGTVTVSCPFCQYQMQFLKEPTEDFDVLLSQVGRQPKDVAMALESILICNLAEAKRQMENLPLTVMRNVPHRKADAVKTRLRELGATAIARPVGDQVGPRGRI